MKKITFFIVFMIFALCFPSISFAEDFFASSENEAFALSPDEHIPELVSEKLDENGLAPESENHMDKLLELAINAHKKQISSLLPEIATLVAIVMLMAVVYKIIDNQSHIKIISYVSALFIAIQLMDVFFETAAAASSALDELAELLSAVIPSFGAVLLLSGSSFSAMASEASLGAVLTLIRNVLGDFLTPAVSVLFVIIISEKISPIFAELRLSAVFKKYFMLALSFTTATMLTVLSFQNILASSKDSLSVRTVKFAASSFIPVVGGAVAESLKTVGAGIKYLKGTVGISVALAIFCIVLPVIVSIVSLKLLLAFTSLLGGVTGALKEKELIEAFVNILDILNGIIICVSILSILIIVLFVTSGINIGAV